MSDNRIALMVERDIDIMNLKAEKEKLLRIVAEREKMLAERTAEAVKLRKELEKAKGKKVGQVINFESKA